MKRRIAVFTAVWAYVACWLWLQFVGPTEAELWLYFFPPGYFFFLGALFSAVHEGIAARWKRPAATLIVVPAALELGHWLYAGNSLGFLLGGILALAVLPASFLAARLGRFRKFAIGGAAL